VLSRLFRGLFLHELEKAFTAGRLRFFSSLLPLQERAFLRRLAPAPKAEWVVFAKRPFAGPQQVLTYVGRYTHRIAIANSRLLSIDDGRVRFRWKDYRRGNPHSAMTLTAGEFIRRFLIHVLPDSFHRIRYFGFLCNHQRERKLARCRELLGMTPPDPAEPRSTAPADDRALHQSLTSTSRTSCPSCGRGHMLEHHPIDLALRSDKDARQNKELELSSGSLRSEESSSHRHSGTARQISLDL
jgi:Putative transposase